MSKKKVKLDINFEWGSLRGLTSNDRMFDDRSRIKITKVDNSFIYFEAEVSCGWSNDSRFVNCSLSTENSHSSHGLDDIYFDLYQAKVKGKCKRSAIEKYLEEKGTDDSDHEWEDWIDFIIPSVFENERASKVTLFSKTIDVDNDLSLDNVLKNYKAEPVDGDIIFDSIDFADKNEKVFRYSARSSNDYKQIADDILWFANNQ